MKLTASKILLAMLALTISDTSARNWAAGDPKTQSAKYKKPYARIGSQVITFQDLYDAFHELGFKDPNSQLACDATKHSLIAVALLKDKKNVEGEYQSYSLSDTVELIEKGYLPYYYVEYLVFGKEKYARAFSMQLEHGKTFYTATYEDGERQEECSTAPLERLGTIYTTFGNLDKHYFVSDMIFAMKDGEVTPMFKGVDDYYYVVKRIFKKPSFSGHVAGYSKVGIPYQQPCIMVRYIENKFSVKSFFVHTFLKKYITKMLADKEIETYDFETGANVDESKTILSFYKDF